MGTTEEVDEPLPYTIIIDDMNDNKPTFSGPLQVTVPEGSKAGEQQRAAGGGAGRRGSEGDP